MKINTNAGITILKFAKHMPNLKSFIHVSTMYANYHVDYIEERFYSYRINHKELIMLTRNLSENEFEKKISRIVSKWPNIYIFTKAIMEQFLKTESGNLPIGIFRPAVISPSASEPLVGWIDNYYGSISFVTAVLCGLTRFFGFNGDFNANLVPVDFTANALITSAWDVFNQCRYDQTHNLLS
ncbi:PREDICTED: putative fatty acyl-CoA reductase CG5065 [Wasmannia auropunctata]|uniref:putative fatty acyl-CoA reductase CG5065 n=1 Tax=Wasmannia auropunctata TaxID=64793 RepID=UPI0005EDFD43|nr:PREDICTED: putative fatty acyl-CoA reductase CG5065 [Wasmannia auropunctata]